MTLFMWTVGTFVIGQVVQNIVMQHDIRELQRKLGMRR